MDMGVILMIDNQIQINNILRIKQLAEFSKQINKNSNNCQFECLSCGFPPTARLIADEGRYVAYCPGCEEVERYECQILYKSGAHECR